MLLPAHRQQCGNVTSGDDISSSNRGQELLGISSLRRFRSRYAVFCGLHKSTCAKPVAFGGHTAALVPAAGDTQRGQSTRCRSVLVPCRCLSVQTLEFLPARPRPRSLVLSRSMAALKTLRRLRGVQSSRFPPLAALPSDWRGLYFPLQSVTAFECLGLDILRCVKSIYIYFLNQLTTYLSRPEKETEVRATSAFCA